MNYQLTLLKQPRQLLYGLRRQSSDKTQSRDIPLLSQQFYDHIGGKPERVLPFYVVSRGYNVASGDFTLFIGDDGSNRGLEREILPAGTYARMEIRPRLGFLWGLTIGKAKRWFYTRWLPASDYEAAGLEYELHTEKATGRNPAIDLLFAVRRK